LSIYALMINQMKYFLKSIYIEEEEEEERV
jgi:hypothetical protein